jgi:hypothetical protein
MPNPECAQCEPGPYCKQCCAGAKDSIPKEPKMKSPLSLIQKKFYDSVKTQEWFTPEEIYPGSKIFALICSRIADKGWFKRQVFVGYAGGCGIEKFKKLERSQK